MTTSVSPPELFLIQRVAAEPRTFRERLPELLRLRLRRVQWECFVDLWTGSKQRLYRHFLPISNVRIYTNTHTYARQRLGPLDTRYQSSTPKRGIRYNLFDVDVVRIEQVEVNGGMKSVARPFNLVIPQLGTKSQPSVWYHWIASACRSLAISPYFKHVRSC